MNNSPGPQVNPPLEFGLSGEISGFGGGISLDTPVNGPDAGITTVKVSTGGSKEPEASLMITATGNNGIDPAGNSVTDSVSAGALGLGTSLSLSGYANGSQTISVGAGLATPGFDASSSTTISTTKINFFAPDAPEEAAYKQQLINNLLNTGN